MWQDYSLMFFSTMFIVFLIPQLQDVFSGVKLNLITTSLTGIGMIGMAYTYSTLGLWATVLSSTVAAVMWFALFYISWRNKQQQSKNNIYNVQTP